MSGQRMRGGRVPMADKGADDLAINRLIGDSNSTLKRLRGSVKP